MCIIVIIILRAAAAAAATAAATAAAAVVEQQQPRRKSHFLCIDFRISIFDWKIFVHECLCVCRTGKCEQIRRQIGGSAGQNFNRRRQFVCVCVSVIPIE